MKRHLLRRLVLITAIVLIVDWLLGALCASGILPLWVFLLFNIPFGTLYVLLESSWMGNHYEVPGSTVSDIGSAVVFLMTVLGQSLAYTLLYQWLHRKPVAESAS